MMKPSALLLVCVLLLSGCLLPVIVHGHLYPVHGPLSAQSPPPIYAVTLRALGPQRHGTMSATLAGGESCAGAWNAIAQDDPSAASMSAVWDSVYGSGFFVANVLGKLVFARATLSCNQGTVLDVEFYDPQPGLPAAVMGVATDSGGNVYKLTFS
jgi:hypothetical protein